MADKPTKSAVEAAPQPVVRTYTFPEQGVSVKAASLAEAVSKVKKGKE